MPECSSETSNRLKRLQKIYKKLPSCQKTAVRALATTYKKKRISDELFLTISGIFLRANADLEPVDSGSHQQNIEHK